MDIIYIVSALLVLLTLAQSNFSRCHTHIHVLNTNVLVKHWANDNTSCYSGDGKRIRPTIKIAFIIMTVESW